MTRPLIIGHRGASALAPENTLAAFALALSEGADGIEFDVRLSRDNVPVVIHDATLQRTARKKAVVSELTSHELSEIDAGSWFNHRFASLSRPDYQKETVPTLESVFELFSKSDGVLYLEMKFAGPGYETLARKCVELIGKHSFAERTIVECFHLEALAEVKRLDVGIRTAALFEPSIKQPGAIVKRIALIDKAFECGADELALHHRLVTPRLIEHAMKRNMPCVVWTVDDPRWIRKASSLGLKAVITNNPSVMIRAASQMFYT